jgi:hypothetical protein
MTKPHLHRLKILLPKVIPYVDKVVIVVGERNQEAEEYIKSFGPQVLCVYRKWDDSFASQWNVFLSYVDEGWVLVCDDDEVPSDGMLGSLEGYVNDSAAGEKFCCVGFRCNPISEGQDMGPCDYYRQIFFRYTPQMKYVSADKSGSHQCLTGYQNGSMVRSRDYEVYYHIKSLEDEYRNAARNYWTYGIWISDQDIQRREDWNELRAVVTEVYPQVKAFPDLDKIMKEGNLHQKLKDWMMKWYTLIHQDGDYFRDHPGCEYWHYNEVRAFYTYYMKYLHPEECLEGMEL